MNFVLLSDIHATVKNPVGRKDDVRKTLFRKLRFIFKMAKRRDAIILQAGDFFDKPRDWNLLLSIINLIKTYKIKIYTVYGQHDTYLRANINKTGTTLGVLFKTGYLNILSDEPVRENGVKIYGASWGQEIPKPKGRNNILVVHAPVSVSKLYPKHKFIKPDEFASQWKKYDLILVGDIHRSFFYANDSTTVINTGPMLRLDATEYNMDHRPCGYVYNSESKTLDKFTIPHEDGEQVIIRSHIEQSQFNESVMEKFVNSLELDIDDDKSSDAMTIGEILLDYYKKKSIKNRIQKIIAKEMEDNAA